MGSRNTPTRERSLLRAFSPITIPIRRGIGSSLTPRSFSNRGSSTREGGLTDIAFTDHDRYHEGIDFDEIEKLRAANPDIKIRAGIELDNDPVRSIAGRRWVEKNWDRLDFVLGSVHFLQRRLDVRQCRDGAEQFHRRNIDEIYADYFHRVRADGATG